MACDLDFLSFMIAIKDYDMATVMNRLNWPKGVMVRIFKSVYASKNLKQLTRLMQLIS